MMNLRPPLKPLGRVERRGTVAVDAGDRRGAGGGAGLEVAVGDVDRDALLALGAQAVGQQRQVEVAVAAALGGLGDVLELVLEDRLGVVQQPPDQGRLAVVDGSGGGDPQQLTRRLHGLVIAEAATRSSPRACGLPSPPR